MKLITISQNGLSLTCALMLFTLPSNAPAQQSDKFAERDKALAEADRKAFSANMEAYERDVKPFLEKHCIACHGPKKLEADLSLDLLDADMKESASGARWPYSQIRSTG